MSKSSLLLLSVVGRATIGLSAIGLPANAATYYLSPTGSDTNSGTTQQLAWRSIDQLNRTTFKPGDRILLQGGATFNGTLQFDARDQGNATQPIVISSYGVGRATISGGANSGISVYNSSGYRIENLKLQGSPSSNKRAAGIVFYTDLAGGVKLDYIRITDVEAAGFESAGISIGSWHPSKSGFRDVQVVRANVHDNRDVGLIVYGYFDANATGYSHQNVYIAYSKAYNNFGVPNQEKNSGSGIVVSDTNTATIEYNEAYNNGSLNNYAKGGPIGIWAWDSTRINLQYNKSHHNRSQTLDGGGFDFDGGVTDSVMQYNYANDNDGAGYLLSQFAGGRASRNITIRYNVSQNDARSSRGHGGIHLWNGGSGSDGNQVYNNTVVLAAGSPSTSKALFVDGSGIRSGIYNNILMTSGNTALVKISQPQALIQFQGNFYWSRDNKFLIDWGGSSYRSFTSWQAATGQELFQGRVVGRSVDPQLVLINLPMLSSSSPAINAGINLSQRFGIQVGTRDYSGRSIPQGFGFEVGAYEVTGR